MKVILVDPESRTLAYKEIDGGLKSWYELIGCNLVEFASITCGDKSFDIVFDEEGCYNADEEGEAYATRFKDSPFTILGKFLVIGVDLDSGDPISVAEDITPEFLVSVMRTGKVSVSV